MKKQRFKTDFGECHKGGRMHRDAKEAFCRVEKKFGKYHNQQEVTSYAYLVLDKLTKKCSACDLQKMFNV